MTTFVLLNFAWLADTITPAYAAHQVPMHGGNFPVVTQSFVDAAGPHGLQVHVWMVNSSRQPGRLLTLYQP